MVSKFLVICHRLQSIYKKTPNKKNKSKMYSPETWTWLAGKYDLIWNRISTHLPPWLFIQCHVCFCGLYPKQRPIFFYAGKQMVWKQTIVWLGRCFSCSFRRYFQVNAAFSVYQKSPKKTTRSRYNRWRFVKSLSFSSNPPMRAVIKTIGQHSMKNPGWLKFGSFFFLWLKKMIPKEGEFFTHPRYGCFRK